MCIILCRTLPGETNRIHRKQNKKAMVWIQRIDKVRRWLLTPLITNNIYCSYSITGAIVHICFIIHSRFSGYITTTNIWELNVFPPFLLTCTTWLRKAPKEAVFYFTGSLAAFQRSIKMKQHSPVF